MKSFREAIERYEAAGHVVRIGREVDAKYEVAAVLGRLERSAVGLIENVTGYDMPVVGNLLFSRELMAAGLGVSEEQLLAHMVSAIGQGVSPVIVESSVCQEVVVQEPDIGRLLPVPTFFEQETGPYITAGVIVAKHPVTGRRNVSIARAKLLGSNRLMLGIAPNHHLGRMVRESLALGRPLEVAISLGNSPVMLMASNFYVDYGHDEFEIAGFLQGEPVQLVRTLGGSLEVPADCEIVLEGSIGDEWVDEGPVSEFHGMYENYGKGCVMTVRTLTRRRDAIFQTIVPGFHAEHMLIGAEAIAATTLFNVRRAVPGVHDVHVPLSSGGRLEAIIALSDPVPGDAQKAMFATWAHCNLIKRVTVVDADVDIRDPDQVAYAVATRMRGEQDLVVVPGVRADRAEPLEDDRTVTKMGLVAVRRTHGSRREFTPAQVPAAVREAVRTNWSSYLKR